MKNVSFNAIGALTYTICLDATVLNIFPLTDNMVNQNKLKQAQNSGADVFWWCVAMAVLSTLWQQ